MARETIAVDIDEVLFPFAVNFTEFHNREYGTRTALKDIKTYHFQHDFGITMEEAVSRVYEFSGLSHDHIEPLEASQEAILDLSEDYDLALVTARSPRFEASTKKWISRHYGDIFAGATFIDYSPAMEKPLKKIDICREIGAVALIDDSLGHVSECAEVGIAGVLHGNYPWNQANELPELVTRCEKWPAVLEYFNGRN
ncbi:MAG TPA: hypothetical protein VK534_00330 [Methylomirabilota bacterium]|nr:hypothetical protein [Methylomirabilota bacterium]